MFPHWVIEYWEVYTVGAKGIGEEVAIPFVHTVQLEGLGRNLIPLQATFNDATMANVIDSVLFATIKEQLTGVTTDKHATALSMYLVNFDDLQYSREPLYMAGTLNVKSPISFRPN
jgi:hypothetical protein